MPNSYFIQHRLHILTLLLFFLVLFGCAGGTETGNPGRFSATSGVAQKGPLQLGSLVTAQEMNANFSPNGKQYTYQVNSNLGTFTPNTGNYTSPYINLNATGYYYDEVTNAVSSGPVTLNGISDLSENSVLNVNLLTTLTYQRIKKLVTSRGLSIAEARTQAENEVLAAFHIPNGSRYGNFSTLDLSKGRDGDNILAAISSIFVLGNNAGNMSALISKFQFDIAEDGVINDAALKSALASSAKALNTAAIAANLSAKYAPGSFTATDLNNWIDQIGDGVVGKFRFRVNNASSSSTFTLPAFAVNQLAVLPISVSTGQLKVNGTLVTGEVTFNSGDTVVVIPAGSLPAGILTIYLKAGSTTFACVTFNRGLTAIAVTPENPSVAKGLTRKFIATGTFTDSSTADISNIVTWTSGNSSIATVSTTGLASGIALGTTTITASSGVISGNTSLNVTAAVLQNIAITPENPSCDIGSTESLTANAVFSDGTTNDITNSAIWTSDNTGVATINAATGLVTGVALGTSLITASYATITGNCTFTVTDHTAPTILSTLPSSNAANIPTSAPITVTFSEGIDAATLSTDSFIVIGEGGAFISGNISYNNKTAIFTPTLALSRNTIYTVTLTTAIKDIAGNSLADYYTWSFTTETIFGNYIAVPTGSYPEAVAIGDVNNDGRNDVVMTTSSYGSINNFKIFVFLQDATGGLDSPVIYATSATYGGSIQTIAIGDINNDGRNDVVIGKTSTGIEVFLQNNAGTLNSGVFYPSADSNKIQIADLNHDGLLDVVGIGWGTNTASVWLQNGSGTLNAPAIYSVTHGGYDDLEVGDVNNDGLPDIVVMSGQVMLPNLGILTQNASGTFNAPIYYSVSDPVTAYKSTYGVAVGDINGDNLNDIVVTYGGNRPYSAIGVFSQNVFGTLNPVVSYTSFDCPGPIVIDDVTSDSRKDIIMLHSGWSRAGVYRQGADGVLQSEELFPIPYASSYSPHGLAVGDINGDGLKDMVIADNNHGLVILYHNNELPYLH